MDPKLKSQLEADAAKLEQSGFDLYQPTFASSGNGRAVIAMQGEGFATQDTTDERVTVQGETVDTSKLKSRTCGLHICNVTLTMCLSRRGHRSTGESNGGLQSGCVAKHDCLR